ncbi:MAG: hypothetical protein ACREA9_15290, partial [Pyrinomonadaceae bacterium]
LFNVMTRSPPFGNDTPSDDRYLAALSAELPFVGTIRPEVAVEHSLSYWPTFCYRVPMTVSVRFFGQH